MFFYIYVSYYNYLWISKSSKFLKFSMGTLKAYIISIVGVIKSSLRFYLFFVRFHIWELPNKVFIFSMRIILVFGSWSFCCNGSCMLSSSNYISIFCMVDHNLTISRYFLLYIDFGVDLHNLSLQNTGNKYPKWMIFSHIICSKHPKLL